MSSEQGQSERSPGGSLFEWTRLVLASVFSVTLAVVCAWLLTPSVRSQHPECRRFIAVPTPPSLQHCLTPLPFLRPDLGQLMDPSVGISVVLLLAVAVLIISRELYQWRRRF